MDEKIVTSLRVKSCVIKRAEYVDGQLGKIEGEVLEVRAEGLWAPQVPEGSKSVAFNTDYPVSLHLTVYPGCGVVPVIGDSMVITVERASGPQE